MSLLLSTHSGLLVSLNTNSVTGVSSGVTAYAGIKYQADGEEFKTPTAGTINYITTRGLWINSGEPGSVWIQWVRSGGTLGDWNSEDAGDARVQMTSDRAWRILRATVGSATIIGEFKAYDAATGGVELGATGTLTFTAQQDV